MYLEYRLTEQEFKDFSYYSGWSSPGKKKARLRYYTINSILYLSLLAIFFVISPGPVSRRQTLIPTLIITIIAFIFLMLYLRFRVRNHYEKYVETILKENGEERILSQLKLIITESGIIGKTDDTETNFKWSAMFKKVVVNNCYYLYLDSRQAIIIPDRVFSSAREKEEFEKILLAYFPLKAELDSLTK